MRIYGRWAGNPKGHRVDTTCCIVEVMDNTSLLFHQCLRKRGYGYNGLFCKQHSKKYASDESISIPKDEEGK